METKLTRREALKAGAAAGTALFMKLETEAMPVQTPNTAATASQADLDRWKTELSNWGRWGKEDQKGTLNLITSAKRRSAAALVKEGFVLSLARDAAVEKDVDNNSPYEHSMVSVRDSSATDRIAVSFHGYAHTHLDSFGHHFHKGKMYNGFSRDEFVTMQGGATKGSVHNMKEGIFTRGVLVDLPRLKGIPFLEVGTRVYPNDIEAWEKQANVTISAGDAIFIRTGRWVRRAQLGPWNLGQQAAGLDVSMIPWLKKRDVAVMGTEAAVDSLPIPPQITDPDDYLPVHNFVLVALGMPLFDDCQLDVLSEAAAARKRWEFLITAAPLPVVNGTGSPINPTAVF